MGEHSSGVDRGDIRLLGRGGPSTVTDANIDSDADCISGPDPDADGITD
jgi:hypothetical protein